MCAQCHARRAQVAEGYRPGRPFGDHYLPSLLTPPLYHADGQQQDEVYVWGSWLQSRMHSAGVTCSDCHDPHSQKLRVPGNGVCAQCHAPATYEAQSHHGHAPGTIGTACADCHMPQNTYMVIDPRRDHSMRVPRPDLSVTLGLPNACNNCHQDRDAQWAAAAVRRWYGRDAAGFQGYAATFAAADRRDLAALVALRALAVDAAQPSIARASALARIAGLGATSGELAQRAARDVDWRVRLAAASVAEALPPEQSAVAVAPLLADPLRAVRMEAARVLAGSHAQLPAEQQPAWQQASAEYVATLRYNADRPESAVALGGFYAAQGLVAEAQQSFDQALRQDPGFEPGYVNAADALRAFGHEAEAVAMLERGLAVLPRSAALHHALGLAQVRQQRTPAALLSLRQAVTLEPNSVRYTYVYAVALHSSGRACRSHRGPAASLATVAQGAGPAVRAGLVPAGFRRPRRGATHGADPARGLPGRYGCPGPRRRTAAIAMRGPLLTRPVHEQLCAARKAASQQVRASVDLGRSFVDIGIAAQSWHCAGQTYPYAGECRDRTIYFWDGNDWSPVARFGTGLIKLVPTSWGPPTFEIDGIKMLPTAQVSPYEDAGRKVALIAPAGKQILDCCGGLGYFAAWCLQGGAAEIVSFEKSADVLWMRGLNPWSPGPGSAPAARTGRRRRTHRRPRRRIVRRDPARPAALRHRRRTVFPVVLRSTRPGTASSRKAVPLHRHAEQAHHRTRRAG